MDPLLSTLQGHVICAFRTVLGTEWNCPQACDPFGRLYYVESGNGEVFYHDRTYALQPGKIYLFPAHAPFGHRCRKRVVIQWVHFTAQVHGGMDLFAYVDFQQELKPADLHSVRKLMSELRQGWEENTPGSILRATGFLFELLSPFLETSDPNSLAERRGRVLRFQPVLRAIRENLQGPLRVNDLARLMHLEPSYFSRFFARYFGIPPVRFILQERIRQSQILLRQTDRTIESIGTSLGFTDGFHFSRTFHKIVGMPPRGYRNQVRSGKP